MSMKISIWNEDKTRTEVQKRFKNAARDRANMESRWKRNERTIYATSSVQNSLYSERALDYSITEALTEGVDQSNADVNVAYAFKNLRFIHAQMSANPPMVAMRPQTSDQDDHRKADAADRIVRWALRHYNMQEKQDQMNLNCLLYGTGFMKTVWDATKGDIMEVDQETEEMKMEGDIHITIPNVWNMYLDPDAKAWDEVKWVMEAIYMDYDEACMKWPDKKDELEHARMEEEDKRTEGRVSELRDSHYNVVQLLEYWETGLPTNGYMGRYCVTTMDGEVIEPTRPSPFRFKQAGSVSKIEALDLPDEIKEAKIRKLPDQAGLPYHMLSDVDQPNRIWGLSAVEWASQLQDNLSRLDSAKLDNIQAHGVARMILPENTEVDEDSLTDSAWNVIRITGNQPPYFMAPPQLMPDMTSERTNYISGINDVMGVNESMFGQQSREQSQASMQYATNQGNMVRRRIFNKFVLVVESEYKALLNLIRKHWTINKTIHVLGKEKALEAIDIKGADIDGGYDVVGEYGTTLSLDPVTRREEILTLQPLFKEAGIPARTSMKMLKLNEVESLFDELDLAENRQKEIFDRMIADPSVYIPPKKYRDHENMIAWAMHYFMSQEFESLPDEVQALCERHIEERAKVAATEQPSGPVAQGPGAAPGPLPSEPAGEVPPPAAGPQPAPGGPGAGPPI